MSISSTLNRIHSQAKRNHWLWLFSIFCRFSLAAGFIPAGIVKIMDERFASGLSVIHPMGTYLNALHHTGFYYTFIGIAQIAAAIFLLIPRTVTLGAFLYFPIILNICILTFAVRFDGSLFTAPLMTLANLFLLGWNYEKWKYILPFNRLEYDAAERETFVRDFPVNQSANDERGVFSRYGIGSLYARFLVFIKQLFSDKFPLLFFAGVFAAVIFFMFIVPRLYEVKPRNSFAACQKQFAGKNRTQAGDAFCNCVHTTGNPLDQCLGEYENAPDDTISAQ